VLARTKNMSAYLPTSAELTFAASLSDNKLGL